MKNVLINKIAIIAIIVPNGTCSNTANNAASAPIALTLSMMFASWKNSRIIAVPPNTENHKAPKIDGTNITPKTNSRIVRPRENRAINVQTIGDQASHQAQSKIVQSLIQLEFSGSNGVMRKLMLGRFCK